MYRLAFRVFSDHAAMVVNHSVTAGTSVGVRWYELRQPTGGTVFALPAGTFRTGSGLSLDGQCAMDGAGISLSPTANRAAASIRRSPSPAAPRHDCWHDEPGNGSPQERGTDHFRVGATTRRCVSTERRYALSGIPTSTTAGTASS
jgi:hypothetical protein